MNNIYYILLLKLVNNMTFGVTRCDVEIELVLTIILVKQVNVDILFVLLV